MAAPRATQTGTPVAIFQVEPEKTTKRKNVLTNEQGETCYVNNDRFTMEEGATYEVTIRKVS